jgi:alpha-ketoglutarate-dependent taurine dioxygenase
MLYTNHPVLRVHPETARKCLFANPGFTVKINELSGEESTMLLDFLYVHMTRPEMVLRHKWGDGDAVLWDNRATMHRTTIEDADPVAARQGQPDGKKSGVPKAAA